MKIRFGDNMLISGVMGMLLLTMLSGEARALELGPANVRSALGERLLVEIPLNNADLAAPACFNATLEGMRQPLGMRKTNNALLLSTPRIIVEPLLSLTVTVRCANIARLERQYTLFIDPASRSPATTATVAPVEIRPAIPQATRALRNERVVRSLSAGQNYTVQIGDTVSELAASIAREGESIWPIVDRIVAENPAAFTNGDANKLIAGAILLLPGARQPDPATRADETSARPASTQAATEPVQVSAPQATAQPNTDAQRRTTDTAKILSVLEDNRDSAPVAAPSSEAATASDSPFKPSATEAAAAILPATAATVDSQGSGTSWLARVLALIGGMALSAGFWIVWQIYAGSAARRRRRLEHSAPLADATQTTEFPRSPVPQPSTYEQTVEIPPTPRRDNEPDYEVAFFDEDDDETFSFHNPAAQDTRRGDDAKAAPVAVKHTNAPDDSDFEVEALESIGMTTIMRGLDEQTQRLLEQDYETELTHTQQLRRDVAERALKLGAGVQIAYEPTEEMPLIDDTGEMLAAEDMDVTLDMAGVSEAAFVDTPVDSDATMPMSLDLDIDDPSVSMVLRESAGMLEDALRDFEQADEPDEEAMPPATKRQA